MRHVTINDLETNPTVELSGETVSSVTGGTNGIHNLRAIATLRPATASAQVSTAADPALALRVGGRAYQRSSS